ncbi:hypothetical protein A3J41_01000 [candidate division TM6 bacterium RIFCSPHIGHO2_12_FULL_38_8]|nr:MAG: hypothetical protein A3J41_01000 [candidate division TM6 bacterium RIFCSPHIGHO2_12_FULL_38_8]
MKKIVIMAMLLTVPVLGYAAQGHKVRTVHITETHPAIDFVEQDALIVWMIQGRVFDPTTDTFDGKLKLICVVNTLEFLHRAEIDGQPASNWVSPNAAKNRKYLNRFKRDERKYDQPRAADRVE